MTTARQPPRRTPRSSYGDRVISDNVPPTSSSSTLTLQLVYFTIFTADTGASSRTFHDTSRHAAASSCSCAALISILAITLNSGGR